MHGSFLLVLWEAEIGMSLTRSQVECMTVFWLHYVKQFLDFLMVMRCISFMRYLNDVRFLVAINSQSFYSFAAGSIVKKIGVTIFWNNPILIAWFHLWIHFIALDFLY